MTPFSIPEEIYATYVEGNRRQAYTELMTLVTEGLLDVTLNAPDYRTQKLLRTARRLYQNGSELEAGQYLTLYRRFLRGYDRWKDDDEFQDLLASIDEYLVDVEILGLDDKGVERLPPTNSCGTLLCTIVQIVGSFILWLIFTLIAIPGLIMNVPLYFYMNRRVNKEVKKALAKSKVKIKAKDVAASQKVINTLKYLPLAYLFYTAVAIGILAYFFTPQQGRGIEPYAYLCGLGFLIVLPLYTFLIIYLLEKASTSRRQLPVRCYNLWRVYSRFAPSCLGGKSRFSVETDVRVKRWKLVIQTQELIQRLTKDDEEWQNDPIVLPEDMKKRRMVFARKVVKGAHRKITDHNLIMELHDAELDLALQHETNGAAVPYPAPKTNLAKPATTAMQAGPELSTL